MHDIHSSFVPLAVVLPDCTWHECPGITEWRALPVDVGLNQSADYERLEQDPAWLDVVREVMRQYCDHTAMLFYFNLPAAKAKMAAVV